MPTTAPNAPPPPPATGQKPVGAHLAGFWDRITDGLEVSELWGQFKADARTSYRLYSREVPARGEVAAGTQRPRSEVGRVLDVAKAFFWAVLTKLSPARRVLLLVALVLLVFPSIQYETASRVRIEGTFRGYAALLLLVLLVLEVADRVTMKRDLEIAREIQLWLVPAVAPQVPGLDVAFVNRPANTVAGDYYDVFPRASGTSNFLITVADVAGKSLPAALLMATFQASLRTTSSTRIPLLELVAGLNRYVCAHSRGGLRFTTAFVSEFVPETGELTYINAGHNAPVLLRSSGTIERLDQGGVPLGIREDAPYQSATVRLHSGDLLIVFTDGLVEAVNDREEEFGEGRLLATLMGVRQMSAEAVMKRVMADVEAFVQMAHQHDDITCLVARKA